MYTPTGNALDARDKLVKLGKVSGEGSKKVNA